MEESQPIPFRDAPDAACSRRRAFGLMLGWCWSRGAPAAAQSAAPVRFAISETMVTDVNINDARAAMLIWLKKMMAELNIVIELSPKVFDTTEDILARVRSGQLDAVAVNIVEYRQVAEFLDPSVIITQGGAAGPEQYLLLVKQTGAIQHLADLRKRRLMLLKSPRMCVAPAWLSTLLEEARLGSSEDFFASVAADTKASRVVLPVFFGQAEACLTSKESFDTMGDLNPQVAKGLRAIAISPAIVPCFYAFHKNYRGAKRDRFVQVCSTIATSTAAGRQLATLFQFEQLTVRDAGCLSSALRILDAAERARARTGAGRRGS